MLNLIDASLIKFNFVMQIKDNNLRKANEEIVMVEHESQLIFFIILHHLF